MIIEKSILDYLLDAGLSVGTNVYCELPVYAPDEYVIVERSGGNQTNHVFQALIIVQSISSVSLYRAMEINEEVVAAMTRYGEESPDVYSCDLNSNYNYPNTNTKEYRYQAIFDLNY